MDLALPQSLDPALPALKLISISENNEILNIYPEPENCRDPAHLVSGTPHYSWLHSGDVIILWACLLAPLHQIGWLRRKSDIAVLVTCSRPCIEKQLHGSLHAREQEGCTPPTLPSLQLAINLDLLSLALSPISCLTDNY